MDRETTMFYRAGAAVKAAIFCLVMAHALITPAYAQAPGWIPTGEWQCGPNVRIVVSTDGYGAMNFFVAGAWFEITTRCVGANSITTAFPALPLATCGHPSHHESGNRANNA